MAEASSSRAEPKSLVDERALSGVQNVRRPTSSGSRRASHFDEQRGNRPSRPTSIGSRTTSNSSGKRASRQQGWDLQNLDEIAIEPPADADPPSPFEEGRQKALRRRSIGRSSGDRQSLEEENLDEVAVGPPAGPSRTSTLENVRSRSISDRRSSTKRRNRGAEDARVGLSETVVSPPAQEQPSSSSTTARKQAVAEDDDADDESSSAPAPFVQRRPEEYLPRQNRPAKRPRWLRELYTLSYLTFFALMGTLARLGVQWLTFYPGAPVITPVLWANFGGSLIMGFLAEDQALFQDEWFDPIPMTEKESNSRPSTSDLEAKKKADRAKQKKTIPLYIGLATGFCGSFTSFSSFARDAFLAVSNNLPSPINHPADYSSGIPKPSSAVGRHDGYSFEAWAAVVITTLALSLSALIVGAHTALFLEPYTPRIPLKFVRRFLDPAMVILGFGCWLGAVFLAIWPPDRFIHPTHVDETWRGLVIFSLVFAPPGCILRFYASIHLNGLVASFPLGTFAVNMLGTAIEGMCYDIQHVGVGVMGRVGGGLIACQALQGVMDGFCGCLTTISTFVAEINGLRRGHGYLYALASVIGALCLMVVIMGSVRWSVGYADPVCLTGYPNKIYG